MDISTVPVVSLAGIRGDADEQRRLADELIAIYHEIGFAVVVDHGLPDGLLDRIFQMMGDFFALPDEEKLLIDKRESRHFRGWEAVGTEYTNNRPDIREQIDLWSEHHARTGDVEPAYLNLLGPNQWVPDRLVPGFRDSAIEWFERLGALANEVLQLFSIGLGLEAQHLGRLFGEESMSLTKFISYPPTPEGGAGVNAHHDAGFLTLLAPGSTPGLQVLDPSGTWIDVPLVESSLVLNIGEMLQAMSGNYLVATAHRVITAMPRLSAAYFHGPSLAMRPEPLELDSRFRLAVEASERHRSAGFMATKEQTEAGVGDMASTTRVDTYGDQLWNYFSRSYPEMMERHHP